MDSDLGPQGQLTSKPELVSDPVGEWTPGTDVTKELGLVGERPDTEPAGLVGDIMAGELTV